MQKNVFAVLAGALLWATLTESGRAQTWQTLQPMPEARQEVTTAVLNGKIYVIGGFDAGANPTPTVQVYNPASNSWTFAQSLPYPVDHHAAAVAAGRLYTLNGLVYDEAQDAWTPVASPKFSHDQTPAVGVWNDKIYVVGGTVGETSVAEAEMYDPATGVWTELAPMVLARNHLAGAFIDGKFYVVGGRVGSISVAILEIYDPETDTWSSGAAMPTARSGIAAAAVNGELWVFGGELPKLFGKVEVYNPGTNSWRSLPDMPVPRHGFWAAVIGDKIHLPGGAIAQNLGPTKVNDVFIVDRTATFANLSTRLKVETADKVLIGGFIITGDTSKRALLRAPGPSVPVAGTLLDPVLDLFDAAGQLLATNNNWEEAPNKQEIIDSGLVPTAAAEPAILTRLAPGGYTAVVRGVNDSTGVALVELYDLEAGSDSQPANISTRGLVQTGDNVLIGGVILTGTDPRRVIVRAIGPSLPLTGTLANPTLELRDGSGALLASNDNWRSSQEAEIVGTSLAPSDNLESAIVRTLSPANYTAIVRGQNDTTGVALFEAYALD